ncbi:g11153 [Coccomyxa elongata]
MVSVIPNAGPWPAAAAGHVAGHQWAPAGVFCSSLCTQRHRRLEFGQQLALSDLKIRSRTWDLEGCTRPAV